MWSWDSRIPGRKSKLTASTEVDGACSNARFAWCWGSDKGELMVTCMSSESRQPERCDCQLGGSLRWLGEQSSGQSHCSERDYQSFSFFTPNTHDKVNI